MFCSYHHLIRADTPDSAPFRRFLPFSPWRASARLHLKKQKSLENPSLSGAKQFCWSGNVFRRGKTRREYCRIIKGLDEVWAHFLPSKPCLPLSSDGMIISCKKDTPIPDTAAKGVDMPHTNRPYKSSYRYRRYCHFPRISSSFLLCAYIIAFLRCRFGKETSAGVISFREKSWSVSAYAV